MAGDTEDAAAAFIEDYAKEVLEEAKATSYHQPKALDTVTVEVREADSSGPLALRTFLVGGPAVAGDSVDVDRCVRTMRCGESSSFRLQSAEASQKPVHVRLVALERSEDLLGDGKLLRTTVKEGKGYSAPGAGMELKVRYSWRAEASRPQEQGSSPEAAECQVLLGPGLSPDGWVQELGDLRRALLRRFGGAVTVRASDFGSSDTAALSERPVREITRCGEVLASGPEGISLAEAIAAVDSSAEAGARIQREPTEIAVRVEDGKCICSAEDWLPEQAALKVLPELRAGTRCLLRVSPPLWSLAEKLSFPADHVVEYDIEMLQVMPLEDVSLSKDGSLIKKTLTEGEGYDRPAEGCTVTLRLSASDGFGEVLEGRELSFPAAEGRFCSAIDETVLTMKKGESCELSCTDVAACTDEGLGLLPGASCTKVLLLIELLDFEKVDIYKLEEAERVAHCAKRKEAGGRFFKEQRWHRALKRYQHVANTLSYLDHWKDPSAKSEAENLRKTSHLNASACHLKLERWLDAEKACGNVLKEEPGNVKALFRRGQALQQLGHFRDAEQSLRKLLTSDPENTEAKRLIHQLRASLKNESQKEREVYSRMCQQKAKTSEEKSEERSAERMQEPSSTLVSEEDSDLPWIVGGIVGLLVCAGIGFALSRRSSK